MTTSVMVNSAKGRDNATDVTAILGALELGRSAHYTFVNTPEKVSSAIDAIRGLPNSPPSLYLDLEGEKLCRDGTISVLQLFVLPLGHTYLFDVYTLKDNTFTVAGRSGTTFKEILQSSSTTKVFFDVRNDSDALYHHYKIALAGIQDLQLMELVTRYGSRKFLSGLAKCIEYSQILSETEKRSWKDGKDKGLKLFAPELGGSYKVFNERPMSVEIIDYCVQDVKFLPRLWQKYNTLMSAQWRERVRRVSDRRVQESHTPGYQPNGRHKALAPVVW